MWYISRPLRSALELPTYNDHFIQGELKFVFNTHVWTTLFLTILHFPFYNLQLFKFITHVFIMAMSCYQIQIEDQNITL